MKKYVLLLTLAVIMLFAFTSCNRNGETQAYEPNEQLLNNYGFRYHFHSIGISIEFPAFWEGKFGTNELGWLDNSQLVEVYHIATRDELYALSGFEYGGRLLSFGRAMDEDFSYDSPPLMAGRAIILGQLDGYTYFALFPSGIEHDSDFESAAEYLEMIGHWEPNHWDFLINSFLFLGIPMQTENPLLSALTEYFEGVTNGTTAAFWVNIDGDGNQGILATRFDDNVFPEGRVFYLYNGELLYLDVGQQDAGLVTGITASENRIVNLMADGGQRSYTLFGIENGRLVNALMLFTESVWYEDEDDWYYISYYYKFPGDWMSAGWNEEEWENRNQYLITQEEFDEIRVRYGLDTLQTWHDWDRLDETEQILAMTFNTGAAGRSTITREDQPTDEEIEALYQRAVEAFGWFQMSSMPEDQTQTRVCENGFTYWRVDVEGISTLAELEAHLDSIFAANIVSELLSNTTIYREFDGVLYTIGASRGGMLDRGDKVHEIIRTTREHLGYSVIIYSVTVDVLNVENLDEVVGFEIYQFPLERIDGVWLFTSFNLVW